MNIFVLSTDPVEAATMECDKHVVKMLLETAQLLCGPHPPGKAPYVRTHFNHPCAKWTRESTSNYTWLSIHGLALCEEYTRRYRRTHRSEPVIEWCSRNVPTTIPDGPLTPFAIAIKDKTLHVPGDPVASYRKYYVVEKSRFARWNYCDPPAWWPEDVTHRLKKTIAALSCESI